MLLRKIDYYGQLILVALSLLSVLVLGAYGFLLGLFILGCWQLISALFNTARFAREGYRAKILLYWKLSISDILLILSFVFLTDSFDNGLIQVFLWSGLAGGAGIAVYYFRIYFTLLERLAMSNELHGIIKSKH